MHGILQSGQENNAKIYLKEIQDAYRDDIISKTKYKYLLIRANNAGFTPLDEALLSGQADILALYLNIIRTAKKSGLLDQNDLQTTFRHCNHAEYNLLHQAAYSENKVAAEMLVNFIQELCPRDYTSIISFLAHGKIKGRYLPRAPNRHLRENDQFNKYLDDLRRQYPKLHGSFSRETSSSVCNYSTQNYLNQKRQRQPDYDIQPIKRVRSTTEHPQIIRPVISPASQIYIAFHTELRRLRQVNNHLMRNYPQQNQRPPYCFWPVNTNRMNPNSFFSKHSGSNPPQRQPPPCYPVHVPLKPTYM